jgi:hypothetical protein
MLKVRQTPSHSWFIIASDANGEDRFSSIELQINRYDISDILSAGICLFVALIAFWRLQFMISQRADMEMSYVQEN